jgi:hypothetical protein
VIEKASGADFYEVQHSFEALGSSIVWIGDVLAVSCRRKLKKQARSMFFSGRANLRKIEKIILVHRQNVVEAIKVDRLSGARPQIRDVDSAEPSSGLRPPIGRLADVPRTGSGAIDSYATGEILAFDQPAKNALR